MIQLLSAYFSSLPFSLSNFYSLRVVISFIYNISISVCEILTFPIPLFSTSCQPPTRKLFFSTHKVHKWEIIINAIFPCLFHFSSPPTMWLIDLWCAVNRARRHQFTSGMRTIQRTVARDMRDACQKSQPTHHSALHHWIWQTSANLIRDGTSVKSCSWIDRPTSIRMARGIIWMCMHRLDSVSRRRI